VIVLNEGYYNYSTLSQDVPVTIGTYNPVTKIYHTFDTIHNSRFASDVIIDNGFIYAAADNKINMYDANSYALVHSATVPGVRKLAVWNNQLLVSRGEYLVTYNSYFQVYNKQNLSFIYDLPTTAGPQFAADQMVVSDDSAYVAINNGFDFGNYKGLIGVVNLNNQSYSRELALADSATNPENLMLAGTDLVTLNNNDFSKSSVSKIGIGTANSSTKVVVNGSGCSTSALAVVTSSNYVLYQAFGDNQLGKYDLATEQVVAPIAINKSIYGIAVNPINNEIYTGVTDFSTFGKIYIHYANGFPRDSFQVSVNPGNIAFDVRLTNGIQNTATKANLQIIETICQNELQVISNTTKVSNLSIVDLTGRTVQTFSYQAASGIQKVNVAGLSAGIYTVKSNDGSDGVRFVKQ